MQNGWPTKNLTPLNHEQVDDYCNRLLEKLFEVKGRAQECISNVTAYRDKAQAFSSNEFLDMVHDAFNFLEPLAKTEEERAKINFHKVPDPLPEEPKIDIPIDYNPLVLDEYAMETFNLKLPEQELLIKWLDLAA